MNRSRWCSGPRKQSAIYSFAFVAVAAIGLVIPVPRTEATTFAESKLLFGLVEGKDSPARAPKITTVPARHGAAAIYDPIGQRMIVFGGRNTSGLLFDTWALTLGSNEPTWSVLQTQGTAPTHPLFSTAIYDPIRDRMLVHGGSNLDHTSTSGVLYELRFNRASGGVSSWTALSPPGAPAARYGHSAVYDPYFDRMIVFGGASAGSTPLGDMWELRLGSNPTWSPMAVAGGPAARYGHRAIYHPTRREMILYGGTPEPPYYVKVWILSLPATGSPAWRVVSPWAFSQNHKWDSSVYDPAEDRIVSFGGQGLYVNPCDDTHIYNLFFSSEPPPWDIGSGRYITDALPRPWHRYGHVAIYDPEPPNNRMIMFGGVRTTSSQCAGDYTNETWSLSLQRNPNVATWTQLSSIAPAAPIRAASEEAILRSGVTALPNPLRNETTIQFSTSRSQIVQLSVYDVRGRLVWTFPKQTYGGGVNRLTWNSRNQSGVQVAAGLYYLIVKGETFIDRKTLIVLR